MDTKNISIILSIDFTKAGPILQQLYSPDPRGAKPRDPVKMLKAITVMVVEGYTSVTKWVEATRKDEAKEIEARDIEEKSTCVSNEPWNVYTDTTQKFEISYPTGKFIRFLCPGEGFLLEPRKTWPGINNDLRIMIEGCGRDRRYAVEILTNKVPYEIQETQTYYNIDRQTIILDGGTKAEKLIGTLDMELLVKSEPPDSYYFGVGVPEHFTRIYFQRDSTYYFISFELDDEKLIDSVLSTLRFIE